MKTYLDLSVFLFDLSSHFEECQQHECGAVVAMQETQRNTTIDSYTSSIYFLEVHSELVLIDVYIENMCIA